MDRIIQKYLNDFYIAHFSHLYKRKPIINLVGKTNYYYITSEENNIISLIPLDFLDEKQY